MSEDVKKIAEELVIACKRAYTRGIQTGSGGNVSARVPGKDLMIVKASGSSFIDSTPDGFVITDFDGNLVEGEGKPTREALLHGLLYRICPKVNAVVHTHSPYSIAWASTGKALKEDHVARPAQDERGFTFVRCSGSDGKERVFPNGGRYI